MPMFDFKCEACGEVREILVSSFDDAVGKERRCGCRGKLEKQLSAPAFTINGYSAANGYQYSGRK